MWQPIETAPRDGSRLMLWIPAWGGTAVFGGWDDNKYYRKRRPYWTNEKEPVHGTVWARAEQPTHWMPLPEPPK